MTRFVQVASVGPALLTVLAGALAGCGADLEAGLLVTVEGIGMPVAPIASLRVEGDALDEEWMDESTFGPENGETEITLPTTLGLRISGSRDSLSGRVEVCVTAQDTAGAVLASACVTEETVPGEIVEVLVVLDFGSSDAGVDAGTDGGAAECGDGVLEGPEDCDGADLGDETCETLGLGPGMLQCDADCLFDTSACTGPPTVPILRRPMNASYLGSVHMPGSMRPTFVWEESIAAGGATLAYELEYGTDPAFGPGLTTQAMTSFTNHQPAADLGVSVTPPVGARYYWRVRACAGMACSDFSPAWYVNVGRSSHDLNGDGYADVAVGASGDDTSATNAGAVYVYFGAATVDAMEDGLLLGEASGDGFGKGAAMAGDVNADGFADLIVGAWHHDAVMNDAGRAYLYFGGAGATLDTTADAVFDGVAAYDGFGASVSSAGDVNADGYADIVVGAASTVVTGLPGSAYMFFGGPTMDGSPDGTLVGDAAQDSFGTVVAGGGDANGDGFGDVIVGAGGNDAGGIGAGRAYVYFGGAGPFDSAADGVMTGMGPNDKLGEPVAYVGDLNDDGYGDFAVGAPSNDAATNEAGAVYVYFGGAGTAFDTNVDGTLFGVASEDHFSAVVPAGDVNADGYDDLLVGVTDSDPAGTLSGAAYFFFGAAGAVFDANPDASVLGTMALDNLGAPVAGVGDVDGDGYDDTVIGSGDPRVVALYLGTTAPLDTVSDLSLTSGIIDDLFGSAVAYWMTRVVPEDRSMPGRMWACFPDDGCRGRFL